MITNEIAFRDMQMKSYENGMLKCAFQEPNIDVI